MRAIIPGFSDSLGGAGTIDLQRPGMGISISGGGITLPASIPFEGVSRSGTLDVVATGITGTVLFQNERDTDPSRFIEVHEP